MNLQYITLWNGRDLRRRFRQSHDKKKLKRRKKERNKTFSPSYSPTSSVDLSHSSTLADKNFSRKLSIQNSSSVFTDESKKLDLPWL
jgi:hypothetical protein